MKKIVNRFLAVLSCFLFLSVGQALAQDKIITVEIGTLSITHLVFASDLTYVNVASPQTIVAKVVQSSKNMLALQALQEFPFITTISALEANGTMHTFYVRYNSSPAQLLIDTRTSAQNQQSQVNTQIRPDSAGVGSSQDGPSDASFSQDNQQQSKQSGSNSKKKDNGKKSGNSSLSDVSAGEQNYVPGSGVNITTNETSNFGRSNAPTIEEVMRKGRNLYHITDKCYGIEAECINVYAYSDVLYIIISISNKSDIGYKCNDAQFTVETKKISSKALTSDKDKWAKSSFGTLSCPPNSKTKMGYTLPKFTLQKNEVFKIYIYEKEGNRNLLLVLDDKDINYAVSPI